MTRKTPDADFYPEELRELTPPYYPTGAGRQGFREKKREKSLSD
jgi:hypothetical protein